MHVTYGFFLTVFFCSLIRASDIPVAPVIVDPITLRIENEYTDEWPAVEKMSLEDLKILANNHGVKDAGSMNRDALLKKIKATGAYNVKVIVEKTRFPYFAEVLADLGEEGAVASSSIPMTNSDITSAAVILLDRLDQIVPKKELKIFTESCEKGTYFAPESSNAFFAQWYPTVAQLHGAIEAADFLQRKDLMNLLLCQYAQQILTDPGARTEAKELEFPKQYDSFLAKILINKALMKKFASAEATPLDINYKNGLGLMASSTTLLPFLPRNYGIKTEHVLSLYPTPGKYSCLVTEIDSTEWNMITIMCTKSGYKLTDKDCDQWDLEESSFCYDQQAAGPLYVEFIIRRMPNNIQYTFKLNDEIIHVTRNILVNDFDPRWKDELNAISVDDLKASKIIFEPNSEKFYLKIQNKTWLCNFLDENLDERFAKEEVELDDIKDPWVKKYLSSKPEELGTCWGIMPCSKDDFFNSCCLDAYRCSEEYKEKIQNDLSKKLNGGDWQVAQQTYNVPNSQQYSLFKDDTAGKYYLTTTMFKLDARAESLIKSMNELYKKTPYDSKKPLYASAAYINRALEKDYRLTDKEMKDAPQEIKEIIFPKGRMNSFIQNYITPYERQIKWGLAGLGLGVASYAVYKTMQRQNNFGTSNQAFGQSSSKVLSTYSPVQSSRTSSSLSNWFKWPGSTGK